MDGLFKQLGHTKDLDISYGDIKQVPVMTTNTEKFTKLFADTILKLGDYADLYGMIEAGTMVEVIGELEEDYGEVGEA